MRCSKARELLSLAMDDQLPPDRSSDLHEHLGICAECLSYQEDLATSRRLLWATEPELPENFDWRLQLKLKQALQESAQTARPPLDRPLAGNVAVWWRNFGLSAVVGAAAVLAMTFLLPWNAPLQVTEMAARPEVEPAVVEFPGTNPFGNPVQNFQAAAQVNPGMDQRDRLPLTYRPGNGMGLPTGRVTGGASSPVMPTSVRQGWSGSNLYDLDLILKLKTDNARLYSQLRTSMMEVEYLKAQLDTAGSGALEIGEE